MVQKVFEKKVKTKMSLISPTVLKTIGEILTKGQKDHKNSEWLFMNPADYLDSCLRHMNEVHKNCFSRNTEDGDNFHAEHLCADIIILCDIIKYHSQLDLKLIYQQDPELIKKLQKTDILKMLNIKEMPNIIETETDYINFKADINNASVGYVCSTIDYYKTRSKNRLIRILNNIITDKTIKITDDFITDVATWVILNSYSIFK